jgi:hypothetical protein
LKRVDGLADYDKDGVSIFHATNHLLETACKNAVNLAKKNNPEEDPSTNVHELIFRFQDVKAKQTFLQD